MESVETELKFIRPIVCYLDGLKRLVSASNGEEEPLLLVAETVPFGMALGLGTTRGSTGGAGGLVTCRKRDLLHVGVRVPIRCACKPARQSPNFRQICPSENNRGETYFANQKGKEKRRRIDRLTTKGYPRIDRFHPCVKQGSL